MDDLSNEQFDEQKQNRRAVRCDQLNKLVELKFGTQRGFKSRCAEALFCNLSNLSQMLKGGLTIPDKYFDELKALPNYVLPELEDHLSDFMDVNEDMHKRVTFDITWGDYNSFAEKLARHLNLDIETPEGMSQLMRLSLMSHFYTECGEKIRAKTQNTNPLA